MVRKIFFVLSDVPEILMLMQFVIFNGHNEKKVYDLENVVLSLLLSLTISLLLHVTKHKY